LKDFGPSAHRSGFNAESAAAAPETPIADQPKPEAPVALGTAFDWAALASAPVDIKTAPTVGVKPGSFWMGFPGCPLCPRKRTCAVQLGMSAMGQKRTSIIF